jgi:hypothetical protein
LQTALCFVLGAGSIYLLTPALTVLGSLARQYPDRGLRDSQPRGSPPRNIHLLVDAFPPGPQYHPRQPYIKEDDENA